jgi:NTE family protein
MTSDSMCFVALAFCVWQREGKEWLYMKKRNIGIALSGGGIRAMIFHLGVFEWLAKNQMLEQIKRVSSVSGASLCVGMLYAHNHMKWPTSEEYLATVLPSIEKALQNNLQRSAIKKLIVSPYYWNKKANIIARTLESKWGVHGKLSELEGDTTWYINCTTYETGKRFRFCRDNMGDYTIGYVEKPEIPISEVMAASAGFPGLVGPYSFQTEGHKWTPSVYAGGDWQPPANQTLHLWDGGVYDNFGLESVFKPDNGGTPSDGTDYLIISNASASIGFQSRHSGLSAKNLKRILDISMDQVAALRSRSVMDFIERTGQGMYIKIGNSAQAIATASGCPDELKSKLIESCLPAKEAQRAMHYATTLEKPTDADIKMLLRHGYEVANCTYLCYEKEDCTIG